MVKSPKTGRELEGLEGRKGPKWLQILTGDKPKTGVIVLLTGVSYMTAVIANLLTLLRPSILMYAIALISVISCIVSSIWLLLRHIYKEYGNE